MATSFINKASKEVGTTPVALYSTPSNSKAILIGVNIANVTGSTVPFDIYVTKTPATTTTTYTVTAAGGKYYIDGVINPTLTFIKGHTYIFDLSDSSNATHPLRFSITDNGIHNSGVEYTTGVTVTGTQGQAGSKVTIVVDSNAPSTLYYYCVNHSGMGNSITVNNVTYTDYYIAKYYRVETGKNVEIMKGNKLVLDNSDVVYVKSQVNNSIDVVLSILSGVT